MSEGAVAVRTTTVKVPESISIMRRRRTISGLPGLGHDGRCNRSKHGRSQRQHVEFTRHGDRPFRMCVWQVSIAIDADRTIRSGIKFPRRAAAGARTALTMMVRRRALTDGAGPGTACKAEMPCAHVVHGPVRAIAMTANG